MAGMAVPLGNLADKLNYTSPARRNRTRSIVRLSPVTSLERAGILSVT